MKALILNSGMGTRMGELVSNHPKCMTELNHGETILSRQLRQIAEIGITEAVITTGYFDSVLVNYCEGLNLPIHITYVNNPAYQETNYIYSIYCAREYLEDDLLLLHGDLVFENEVLDQLLEKEESCMAVSSLAELPQKDFKAVIRDGRIQKIGIEVFNDSFAAQPLYKLLQKDWNIWLEQIVEFCKKGRVECYAETAWNEVAGKCCIVPLDIKSMLCSEIDTQDDWIVVQNSLKEIERRTVYMCFSTDILHSGHIALIKKAKRLGKLMVGVMSDEAVASYRRFPLLPFLERKAMFENIVGVYKVVEQKSISYKENLQKYQPSYVVHGDDWLTGFQRPIRDEVVSVLAEYGGRLVEFPYASDEKYAQMEVRARADLAMPDLRRGRLRKMLAAKGFAGRTDRKNRPSKRVLCNWYFRCYSACSGNGGIRHHHCH